MLQSVETIQNSHTSKTIIQTEYNPRYPCTNLDETTLKRSSQRKKRKNNDDSRPPSYNLLKQSQPHFEIWSNNNIIQTTYGIPVQISMKQHGRLRSLVKKSCQRETNNVKNGTIVCHQPAIYRNNPKQSQLHFETWSKNTIQTTSAIFIQISTKQR